MADEIRPSAFTADEALFSLYTFWTLVPSLHEEVVGNGSWWAAPALKCLALQAYSATVYVVKLLGGIVFVELEKYGIKKFMIRKVSIKSETDVEMTEVKQQSFYGYEAKLRQPSQSAE